MGSSGMLSGQFSNYGFLEVIGSLLPRVHLASDNRDNDNIIDLNKRRLRTSSPSPQTDITGLNIHPRQPQKLSSAEILLDLRLPPDLFEHFINLLEPVGYKLEEDEVTTFNYDTRKYNYVRKGNAPIQPENTRYLIYIPSEILNDPARENLALINEIFTNFSDVKPGSSLMVFSNLNSTPDRRFRDIIIQRWRGNYVPWTDIQELGSRELTEKQKTNMLTKILELPP